MLDTGDGVPVRADLEVAPNGGFDVEILAVDRGRVTPTGSVPKGISHSEVAVTAHASGVRCRFLVDV